MASFLDSKLAGSKKLRIGLDIGSSFLKAVALEESRKDVVLYKFAIKDLPQNAIADKDISDRETVIFTIQNLMEEIDPKATDVVISVSGNKVFSDKITVKKQSKASALREQVMTQAEERVPMGTEGVSIGYFPITDNDVGKNIDVELVAARSDFIRSYVELVHDAGYTVTAVDVDGLANFNAFANNYEISPESVICLMDIGHSITNLVFIIQGYFFSMRDISIGMHSMWDSIQGELSFSNDEMQNLMDGIYDTVDMEQFQDAVDVASGDLKVSLDTAFNYLETITQGQMVSQIYLTGGGTLVPNMAQSIGAKMGLPAEIINPFKDIVGDPSLFVDKPMEQFASLYTVAMGMALRAE
ncbi:MAG: type IV pilus assembly protein PilM [Candidatus Zixiibacteriota bacterium]